MTKLFYSALMLISLACLLNSCQSARSTGEGKTKSGYKYTIHEKGNGQTPVPGDYVFFEMEILGEDNSQLQNMKNLQRMPVMQIPESINKNAIANPIQDLLAISSVGDSVTLFIPIDSIPNPPQNLQGFSHVQYVVCVRDKMDKAGYDAKMEQEKQEAEKARAEMAEQATVIAPFVAEVLNDYKAGKLDKEVITHDSGLKYIIHKEGTGRLAKDGENVEAHYYGINFDSGEMFDNSYRAGRAFSFPLNQGRVIRGWDVGFGLITEGTEATFIIPYQMAYGEAGRSGIPPKADLVFHVNFLQIL